MDDTGFAVSPVTRKYAHREARIVESPQHLSHLILALFLLAKCMLAFLHVKLRRGAPEHCAAIDQRCFYTRTRNPVFQKFLVMISSVLLEFMSHEIFGWAQAVGKGYIRLSSQCEFEMHILEAIPIGYWFSCQTVHSVFLLLLHPC